MLPGLLLGITLLSMCIPFAHLRNVPRDDPIPLQQALKIAIVAKYDRLLFIEREDGVYARQPALLVLTQAANR